MNATLILGGLYDQKLSKKLLAHKELGLGFDFRPKSFNFLQQHKFNELLNDLVLSRCPIMMKFSNEKQFLIQKFIDDIEKKVGMLPSNVFLEVSGEIDCGLDAYKLALPVFYHLSLREPAIPDYLMNNLRGVIIDDLYELINKEEELLRCIKRLHQLYPWLPNLDIGLKVDWSSDISASWLHTLGVKFLYVEINHYVEDGYRQVNLQKLHSGLDYFLSQDHK
jgi:hypothetical protein